MRLALPFLASGFFEQMFQGAQFVQPQGVQWPKGVKNEIAADMGWLKGTEWYWNKWRNIKLHKDGRFEAPTQDCAHMGLCEWAAHNGKVYVMWGQAGLHILEPTKLVPDQDEDKLKGSALKGKRKKDGDKVQATFVKIFDYEAFQKEMDLYGALGVDEDADEGTIKRAYRKLSMEYHPDKNPGVDAKKKFNEVRDAYEILNSKEKKILYDTGGMEAIYEHKKGQVEKGETATAKIDVTLKQLYIGHEDQFRMTRRVVCRGCRRDPKKANCKQCSRCPDEVRNVQRQMGPGFIVQQQERVRSEEYCKQEHTFLPVHLERGMKDGQTLTFEMMADQRPKSIPGDVVVTVKQAKHKIFHRRGNDLTMTLAITLRQAVLGFEKTISHLDGHDVKIRRTGVTKPNAVMKVEQEGMPLRDDPGSFGDLHITFFVAFPDSLSEVEQKAVTNAFPATVGDIVLADPVEFQKIHGRPMGEF